MAHTETDTSTTFRCSCGFEITASPTPPDDGEVGNARCPHCESYSASPVSGDLSSTDDPDE